MGQSTAEQLSVKQATLVAHGVPTPGAEVVLRRMAGCMAHHVNNALTGVIGYLELSLREASGKGNLHSHLQAGLACAYQAAETVKRLVTIGTRPLHMGELTPVSLRQLVDETALKVRNTRGAYLRVVAAGAAEATVVGNAGLLREVLEQIVRNAVEAMPHEGTLTLRLEEDSERSHLHVGDTGHGLSAEAAAHLFDPFWTSKPNGHLGLGLVLCRDMLHVQGGLLSVASAVGVGTTVTLSLPTAVPSTVFDQESTPAIILAPSSGALVAARS